MYGISFQKLPTLTVKGGLSAYKFSKSQIRKLLDIPNLRTFLKYGNSRIWYFRSRCFWRFPDLRFPDAVFCGLKLSQIRNYLIKMRIFKFVLKKFKEQAFGLILAGFYHEMADKDPTFEKRISHPRCPILNNLRI